MQLTTVRQLENLLKGLLTVRVNALVAIRSPNNMLLFLAPLGRRTSSKSGLGVVGWCEGVMYLTSPGHPADIGLQMGKVRVEGECFYFVCFFTFILVSLSFLSHTFISSTISSISFLPFSGRRHKMTHEVSLNPNTVNRKVVRLDH